MFLQYCDRKVWLAIVICVVAKYTDHIAELALPGVLFVSGQQWPAVADVACGISAFRPDGDSQWFCSNEKLDGAETVCCKSSGIGMCLSLPHFWL